MANITAAMVKELREMSGAGMMDCKKALTETNGDMDGAVEYLRKNGIMKAEKKASRIAAEGLTRVAVLDDKTAAVVEVNSETDFVAKNEKFQTYVNAVANQAKILSGKSLKRPYKPPKAAYLQREESLITDYNKSYEEKIGVLSIGSNYSSSLSSLSSLEYSSGLFTKYHKNKFTLKTQLTKERLCVIILQNCYKNITSTDVW